GLAVDGDRGEIAGGADCLAGAEVEAAIGIAEGADRRAGGSRQVGARGRHLVRELDGGAGREVAVGPPVGADLDAGSRQAREVGSSQEALLALARRAVPAVDAAQLRAG